VPCKPRIKSPQNLTRSIGTHIDSRVSSAESLPHESTCKLLERLSEPLEVEDLAQLRAFFELLAKWDAQEGVSKDG
jgi:hypothetical protein